MQKIALNLIPKNPEVTGALAGSLLGGTAGTFLADAFWDQPTRIQRLISGVTGLIIGGAGGLAAVKTLNRKKQPNALTLTKEMSPQEAQQLGKWQKAWKGIDDPDEGNIASSAGASIMHRLRNASPVSQDGDISWSTATLGALGGAAGKYGFTRYVQQGFQNARDFRNLKQIAKAKGQDLKTKGSTLNNIFLSRSKLNKILKRMDKMPVSDDIKEEIYKVKGYLPDSNLFWRRNKSKKPRFDLKKYLSGTNLFWRGNRSKRLGKVGHGVGLLSALIAATATANATGFNRDRNKIKELLEEPK